MKNLAAIIVLALCAFAAEAVAQQPQQTQQPAPTGQTCRNGQCRPRPGVGVAVNVGRYGWWVGVRGNGTARSARRGRR